MNNDSGQREGRSHEKRQPFGQGEAGDPAERVDAGEMHRGEARVLRLGVIGFQRPPKGGDPDALAAAWLKVLALTRRTEEEVEVPGERYSVEQRTAEIEALMGERSEVTFATLLGDRPTLGYAIVTFIALLDLYRRLVIDITQDELFGEIRIERKVQRMEGLTE